MEIIIKPRNDFYSNAVCLHSLQLYFIVTLFLDVWLYPSPTPIHPSTLFSSREFQLIFNYRDQIPSPNKLDAIGYTETRNYPSVYFARR